jgi:beta-mannosidase
MIPELFNVRSWDQHRVLRKPAYTIGGWDWCDPLPNVGIWKSVRLEGRSHVVLDYVRLDTEIDGDAVALVGEVSLDSLHPWKELACTLELRLVSPDKDDDVVERIELSLPPGRTRVPISLSVPNAHLWWPNGMGDQPLYELHARVMHDAIETDAVTQTIGVRTIELDRSPQPDGSRFCFKVNGEDLFANGGNWAPADLIPARVDAARYEHLVAEAKNANFNMLRINGCGIYESDEFYAACDRAGILVWQDFIFSDAMYPDDDPAFVELVRPEVEAAVRRLRHHPSLALWCGNNECSLSMVIVWFSDEAYPEEIGGVRLYHELIPDICHFYDPRRPYWPSSPVGGTDPLDESAGDVHGWGRRLLGLDADTTRDKWREIPGESRARFHSETFAYYGPPHMDSIREYLAPDEISFDSTAWKIHSNAFESGITAAGIDYHYGDAAGLSIADFVLYGQMYQALLQQNAVEATRFRKADPEGECSGALTWSYNETWGEIGWAMIDHYARRKASYYAYRRTAAPVKVLVRPRGSDIATRVVNDTRATYETIVRYGWMRIDGSASELDEQRVAVPANGAVEVHRAALPSGEERDPAEWIYVATAVGDGIANSQAAWPLAPYRQLALAGPVIETKVDGNTVTVESPVYCHGVHYEDDGRGLLSDNHFDLLPGVPLSLEIVRPLPSGFELKPLLPIAQRAASL